MEALAVILVVAAAALYLIRRYVRAARLLKQEPSAQEEGRLCDSCDASCPHAGPEPRAKED